MLAAVLVLAAVGAVRGDGGDKQPATPRIAPIAQQGGSVLLAEPAQGAAKLADLPYGMKVEVLCHTRGPETSGWGGTSKVWDKVKAGGATGFVPDVAVNTVVNVGEIAPRC
ncbi:hypothetical protein [Yinghuangia soli]|uniref:SH3 domain-containing protein n=1 Tax=Yinghuangia soli TaxID=2908204 RepID=A0AA41U1Y3_9ACTN|nr:hypothetical protein [Yinghuangia soli]MCF2526559.1 hypothetical protein [Yinghuangia soli]